MVVRRKPQDMPGWPDVSTMAHSPGEAFVVCCSGSSSLCGADTCGHVNALTLCGCRWYRPTPWAGKPRAEFAAGQALRDESLRYSRAYAIVLIPMVRDTVEAHCCIARNCLELCLQLLVSGQQRPRDKGRQEKSKTVFAKVPPFYSQQKIRYRLLIEKRINHINRK